MPPFSVPDGRGPCAGPRGGRRVYDAGTLALHAFGQPFPCLGRSVSRPTRCEGEGPHREADGTCRARRWTEGRAFARRRGGGGDPSFSRTRRFRARNPPHFRIAVARLLPRGLSGSATRWAFLRRGRPEEDARCEAVSSAPGREGASCAPGRARARCAMRFVAFVKGARGACGKGWARGYTSARQVHRRNALTRTVGTNPSPESRRMLRAGGGRPERHLRAVRRERCATHSDDLRRRAGQVG